MVYQGQGEVEEHSAKEEEATGEGTLQSTKNRTSNFCKSDIVDEEKSSSSIQGLVREAGWDSHAEQRGRD